MRTRRMDRDELQDELLRRMAEPEYLRKLRRQAERIEQDRERDARDAMWKLEADRLRRQIRDAGHKPVCCATIT
jgi:hypothetical protein